MASLPRDVSPGAFVSLHCLIFKMDGADEMHAEIAVRLVEESGLLGGTMPVNSGIRLGVDFGLIENQGGSLRLTEYCVENVSPHCITEEPSIESWRAILFKVLSSATPTWLAFFSEDEVAFRSAIPDAWIDLLEEAELLSFDDPIAVEWWKFLLSRFHEREHQRTTEIGDVGEQLTVLHEKGRLPGEIGAQDTDTFVIWVSRISNDFGYDVRSVLGSSFKQFGSALEEMKIEVKSSVLADARAFRFRVTRNEWKVACRSPNQFFFYCWTGIDIGRKTARSGPYVISATTLLPHFPTNQASFCEWTECAFEIDLTSAGVAASPLSGDPR